MLLTIKRLYQELSDNLHVRTGKKAMLTQKFAEVQKQIQKTEQQIDVLSKASVFLQTLSDTTREETINKISAIVTDALQKVKDPNLEFKMTLSTERNQLDVKFLVVDTTTQKEYDILTSCGGSIADIITFPLRVCLLMKWDPKLAQLIVMDESFKFVSVQDQSALGDFVRQVSEKLNLQIILVSHSQAISDRAHKIFEVTKKDGTSVVEEKPS